MNTFGRYLLTIGAGLGIGATIVATGICTYNLGKYEERKSFLIDSAVRGKHIDFSESNDVYKNPMNRVFDLIDFGSELADKRFKAGEFDQKIKSLKQ